MNLRENVNAVDAAALQVVSQLEMQGTSEVEAINSNYAEFISLSEGMVGVDAMIDRVREPLDSLRTEAMVR